MKIAIHTDNQEIGYVFYIEGDHTVMVTHPNEKVRSRVYQYLTNSKEFVVPGGDEVGDRRTIEEKPNKNIDLMNMSLCEMYSKIGVHVDWNSPDNISDPLNISKIKDVSSEDTVNKPIIKSVYSTESFEIIN